MNRDDWFAVAVLAAFFLTVIFSISVRDYLTLKQVEITNEQQ